MRITEEYKKSGYFWLPENPSRKIPGTLTIQNGGRIELEIVGVFNEDPQFLMKSETLDRIVGHIEKDGYVTLDDCLYTNRNMTFGGISKSKIFVHKVFSSVAYDKNEEVTFNTYSFSVDCLDNWVSISGIKVQNDFENRAVNISYSPPQKMVYNLENGMQLEICFAYTFPSSSPISEAKITQRVYFKLSSDQSLQFTDYSSVAYKLINFLCFAIDDTVCIKDVTGTSKDLQTDYGEGNTVPVSINIYYPSIPFNKEVSTKSWHNMLFTFGAIRENTELVLNNWLKSYDVISPTLNLYFSTKQGARKQINDKFLALAQGLETYHRRTSDETLMESSKFDSLVERILENCPDENKQWLNGRLMHGNEINFGKRIKSIIEPFKEFLGTQKTRKKLIRAIVDTRNYLTHYNEDLKDNAHKGEDLWKLYVKMEAIFQLHFMKLIGFTDYEIKNVIESSEILKRKL